MSVLGLFLVVSLSTIVQAQSDGELRLVRGTTTSYSYTSGRLEFYTNGKWGTICNGADFGLTEATVACQQLGWSGGALSYGYSESLGFGQGNGTILLDDVNCYTSSYLHLQSCQLQFSRVFNQLCNDSSDVAVYCNPNFVDTPYELQVRLVGGSYPSQGRVEVYCNGQWGTICNTSGFGSAEAETVCRQLGYAGASSYNDLNLPGNSNQPIWLKYFSCGLESQRCLDLCTSCPSENIVNCTHGSDVTVQCDIGFSAPPSLKTSCPSDNSSGTPSYGELRLVHNDTTSYNYTSGRLEIYINDRWGTICNDANFGFTEATVACQQLGWNGAWRYGNSRSLGFGQGNETILLDDVSCYRSSYLHLLSCRYSTTISHHCDHSDDVAVRCYSARLSDNPYALQVRLAEGSYPSQGRVEVYCNGQWGTICNTSGFGSTEAETVCRQLGYTDARNYNHLNLSGESSQPIWLEYFSCGTHSDRCLDLCTSCPSQNITNCTHSSDVTVQCDYMSGYSSRRTSCPSSSGGGGGGGGGGGSSGPMADAGTIAGIAQVFVIICCCVLCCIPWYYLYKKDKDRKKWMETVSTRNFAVLAIEADRKESSPP